MPIEQNLVLLFEFVAWMRNPVCQFTIVRKQKQTRCRPVEPSDWNYAFRYVNEVKNGTPATLILRRRNVAWGFVQQNISLAFVAHRFTVNLDPLLLRIHPEAKRAHDLAVD
jgi:hypothetical protein